MAAMDMATSTAMDMATSTAMDMSTTTALMGMDSMAMTFFTSTSTPLYSSSWTPYSTAQYFGTCVFLIAFATAFRGLLAIRINFFEVLAVLQRRSHGLTYPYAADDKSTTRPWRANEALMLASADVVLAGIGYLLLV
jgi:copper transporter 1